MARGLRDLRRKMKAIKSTRQVTKAMELVAASKMRRAVQNAVQLRDYALAAWGILQRIAGQPGGIHPFLEQKPVERILAVVFATDRGLCGSLNTQLFRSLQEYLQIQKTVPSFESIEFVAVGRKSQQFLARTGQKVVAAFPALSNHPAFRHVLPLTRFLMESFLAGTYDHVVLLYPDFVSPLVQEPVVKVLLPFSMTELRSMIESLLPRRRGRNQQPATPLRQDYERQASNQQQGVSAQYLFEPSSESVLAAVLPQLTEFQVYQAVLEAAASEHSARMVAMHSASDNASSLLDDLTLTYNQTRQAGITAELAELSASKAALET